MIYIVEDAEIRELETYALNSSGFEVKSFDCAKSMDEEVKANIPDLFILDIMLPGEDGLSILKRLRAQESTKNVPVIMLTAKSTELDKVKGLDLGADDYIAKPFGILEFISRVKALLRRAGTTNSTAEEPKIITLGKISLDRNYRDDREFCKCRALDVDAGDSRNHGSKHRNHHYGMDYVNFRFPVQHEQLRVADFRTRHRAFLCAQE